MFVYMQRSMNYFSRHVILGNFAHAIGGFGFALLLQHYIKSDAFLPIWISWLMVLISIAIHVKSVMKG